MRRLWLYERSKSIRLINKNLFSAYLLVPSDSLNTDFKRKLHHALSGVSLRTRPLLDQFISKR